MNSPDNNICDGNKDPDQGATNNNKISIFEYNNILITDDCNHSISEKEMNYLDDGSDGYLEEYEQWSNAENSSKVGEQFNAPRGDASNVHHAPDPITFDRGSKMYANDISASALHTPPYSSYSESKNNVPRIEELKKLGIQTETVTRNQLILGKYLPVDLVKKLISDSGKKAVLLGAGLGLGKSTVMSSMMLSSKTGRGMAISHRVKLTSQLSDVFQAANYQDVKSSEGGEASDRVATTIHSLDAIHNLAMVSSAVDGGICAADEFESIANELNQHKTLRNAHKAIAALKDIAKKSNLFIAADAHPSSQSIELLSVIGFDTKDVLFIDVERPELEGFKVDLVIQNENDSTITPFTALLNKAANSLSKGQKVLVVGLSRAKLEQGYRELESKSLNPFMVTSQTKASEVDKLNPDSYQNHDLVILSTSMSTGISFDGSDNYLHADQVLVHASNYAETGGVYDALQALFRDRKPKSITVYYETGDTPLSQADKFAKLAKHRGDRLEEIFSDYPDLRGKYTSNHPDHEVVDNFLVSNQVKQAEDKLDFLNIMTSELIHKGAEVNLIETSSDMDGAITPEALKKQQIEIRAEIVESIGTAIKITEETNESDISDELLQPALTRRYIESETCTDLDTLSLPDRSAFIDAVLPEYGGGILAQVRNIERAFSDQQKVNFIVNSSITGVSCFDGDKVRFMEGRNNQKIYWQNRNKYIHLCLKALGIERVDGNLVATKAIVVISEETIKCRKSTAYSLSSSLKQNPNDAIQSGLVNITAKPYQVKQKTAKHIIDILQKLLAVKVRKLRGKEAWSVDIDSIASVLNIVNARSDAGINGVDEYYQRIQEFIDLAPVRQNKVIQKDNNTIQTISNAEVSIREYMIQFERAELIPGALEWMEAYENRINSGQIKHSSLGVLLLKFIANQPVDNFAKGLRPLKR